MFNTLALRKITRHRVGPWQCHDEDIDKEWKREKSPVNESMGYIYIYIQDLRWSFFDYLSCKPDWPILLTQFIHSLHIKSLPTRKIKNKSFFFHLTNWTKQCQPTIFVLPSNEEMIACVGLLQITAYINIKMSLSHSSISSLLLGRIFHLTCWFIKTSEST